MKTILILSKPILLILALIGLLAGCSSTPTPAAVVPTPIIGEPKIGAPSPQQPGQELGISIDISSVAGVDLSYTWQADGGEIVRGQGSPAITYRTPVEPGIYNVRVTVAWDGHSAERVTMIRVEAEAEATPTPEPVTDTPTSEPPTDTPTPKPTPTPTEELDGWDARVRIPSVPLRYEPNLSSPVAMNLPQGTTIDLLAVGSDKAWVQARHYGNTGVTTGWLQVIGLEFNIALDSLPVEEVAIAPTSTPAPTDTPSPPTPTTAEQSADTPLSSQSTSSSMEGKVVTVFGALSETHFKEAMAPFEAITGIRVEYERSDNFSSIITERVENDNPPDLAVFPQPGLLGNLVYRGYTIDLHNFLDETYLKQQYEQSWLDMATMNGQMAGIWYDTYIKSLVWYPTPEFEQAGYQIPQTWDEMIALTNQMVADGYTPWCIGIESGGATGWVATDWIEDIMLRTTSPQNYDKWTRGEIKFNSPEVRRAMEIMGTIWLNTEYVYGGTNSIAITFFGDSPNPLFDNPPGCWLHRQANFIPSFFPGDVKVGKDVNYFYLPPIDLEYGKPLLISGDIVAMFNDRPEVRELVKYLTTGESVRAFIEDGIVISPHKDANLDWYPAAVERGYADILINADTLRFDASDLMPGEVGAGSFWTNMVDYANGKSLDAVLNDIDSSWPK